MREAFIKEKLPLTIILSLYLLLLFSTYGSYGNLFVDCGREAYIPYAISQGKYLYKDIFCIYGPFPYLFIAFFYKIFAINLNVLYIIGATFGLAYIIGTYFCAREFLTKSVSTCICILVIFSVIYDPSIFNFIFPYSYAAVFASTFSIWILYFLIKYLLTKKPMYMRACAFLWGAICVCKVDFIPLILLLIPVYILFEKNKKQEFKKCLLIALIIPSITYLILFTQGINIADISKNSSYVNHMINTDTLYYFYKKLSVMFFNTNNFLTNIKNLIFTGVISLIYFSVSLFAIRRRNKFIKYGLTILITIFCCSILALQQVMLQMHFSLLPYICTIIFIYLLLKYVKIKECRNTEALKLLIMFAFAIICSLKSIHSLLLSFYGAYSFAPILICIIYFIKELLKNNALYNTKKQYEAILCIYILIFSFLFAIQMFAFRLNNKTTINTNYGKIKVNNEIGQPFQETLNYIKTHANPKDEIVTMPEGIMINFLLGSVNNFYQTSFIPLDFETFGENNIIKEIKAKNPELIILTNRKTDEYGKNYICRDYGIKTCKYIIDNYAPEAAFGDKFRIYIFKYKNKDAENEEK